MITVHHLENSRSQRVLWLLEELDQPYRVVRYERDSETMLAPPELRAVHPLGKSPIIVDAPEAGESPRTIAETAAILEYLVDKAGGRFGAPADAEAALHYRHFLHYALLVESQGRRTALLIMAVGVTVLVAALSLVVRDGPAQSEREIHGAEPGASEIGALDAEDPSAGIGAVLRTGQFWALAVGIGMVMGIFQAWSISFVPLALSIGFTTMQGASLISLFGMGTLSGMAVFAVVADRMDRTCCSRLRRRSRRCMPRS